MALFNQMMNAQQRFQLELLAKNGVVGVGVGYRETRGVITDELSLVAMVEQKRPVAALAAEDVVPREIDGTPIDVMEVGLLRAHAANNPRQRFRPTIPGGVSIGHPLVTAGTLGFTVRDRTTNEKLLLSNNHVIANSNDAFIGDPVLQPGPTDGGQNPSDSVATLARYMPIRFIGDPVTPPPTPIPPPDGGNGGDGGDGGDGGNGGGQPPPPPPGTGCDIAELVASVGNALARLNGSDKRLQTVSTQAAAAEGATRTVAAQQAIPQNQVDCAVGRPNDPGMFPEEILEIGAVTGTTPPSLGMRVRKFGRTTGYTEGLITLINATVDVSYNTAQGTRTARFVGQVMTSGMSQGGDSGSLIVHADSADAVGLLFAGSGTVTIFSPIQLVLDTLNLRIGPPAQG